MSARNPIVTLDSLTLDMRACGLTLDSATLVLTRDDYQRLCLAMTGDLAQVDSVHLRLNLSGGTIMVKPWDAAP